MSYVFCLVASIDDPRRGYRNSFSRLRCVAVLQCCLTRDDLLVVSINRAM
jgi:hypothetical protein